MPLLLTMAVAMLLVDPEPPRKKDLDAIQGTWSESIAEVRGRKQPRDFLFPVKVTFDGDKVMAKVGRREPELRGTLKLDESIRPRHYDLTTPEGRSAPAIYELDGDTLKVCISGIGEERPTSFETTPANEWTLIVYKREKPAGR